MMKDLDNVIEKRTEYEQPFGESPFDLFLGWEGGAVETTGGGGNWCRIWWLQTAPDVQYSIIYNVDLDTGVCLERFEGEDLRATGDRLYASASTRTDEAKARVAQNLMQRVTQLKLLGVSDEHIFGAFADAIEEVCSEPRSVGLADTNTDGYTVEEEL